MVTPQCPRSQKRGSCVTPIVLRKSMLSHYGYKGVKDLTPLARHRALLKAIKGENHPWDCIAG